MDIYFFDLCLFAIFYLSLFPLFIPGFLRGVLQMCVYVSSPNLLVQSYLMPRRCVSMDTSLCTTGNLIRIMQLAGPLSRGKRLFSLGNVRVFK